MKALGPLKLTVTLTDYLKSPSVDTPVVAYLDTFCQSLEVERDPLESFCQTLEPEGDSLTLMDLDSGDITPMDQPVWAKDADQWLDNLTEDLEDTVDTQDLLEDMSVEDWEQVMGDVLDQFDLDAFVT